jgi:hypothetical protein
MKAPSSTRKTRSTSALKSTWPGCPADEIARLCVKIARRGLYGDSVLALNREVVGGGGALVDIPGPLAHARNVEQTLVTDVLPASMWARMPMFRMGTGTSHQKVCLNSMQYQYTSGHQLKKPPTRRL